MFDFVEFSLLNWFVGIVVLVGGAFAAFWAVYACYRFRDWIFGGFLVLFFVYCVIAVFIVFPAIIGSLIL